MLDKKKDFLFVDVEGHELTKEDVKVLEHPYVSGVILFTRNYSENEFGINNLKNLIKDIKSIKGKNLKISVDHEGGDVQRFRSNFTLLPKASEIEEIYKNNNAKGLNLAYSIGKTAGFELLNIGVDINFAPSVDLKGINNKIVNTRSFGSDKNIVIKLAKEYIKGISETGVLAVAKHFPGHGFVEHDSHYVLPVDHRSIEEISKNDLKIYQEIFKATNNHKLSVMTSHIIYSKIDNQYPASLSELIIKKHLRNDLKFNGVIFSDDLNMHALNSFGSPLEKVRLALKAGCDYLLYCNNRKAVLEILETCN